MTSDYGGDELITIPQREELFSLMGEEHFALWTELTEFLENEYLMDKLWDKGRDRDVYELKYRRGGKTLCCLYPRHAGLGALVILGKVEREKYEARRAEFGEYVNELYDRTRQYHDGKWLFMDVTAVNVRDIKELILIKRKPNRK